MPRITYPFPNFPTLEMLDIFRRVAFTQKTLNNAENWTKHTVVEGQKPEDLSLQFYGDSRYWWVILLSNNIIDYRNEWPKTSREIANIFDNFLKGRSLYVFEDLPIKQGDVVVRRDVTAEDGDGNHTSSLDMDSYGVVDNYDRLLHKIDVKKTKGTISSGDEIYIFRKGFTAQGSSGAYHPIAGLGQTGCYQPYFGATMCVEITGPESNVAHPHWGTSCNTAGSTFAIVQKATDIKDSAIKFRYKSDEANPYASYPAYDNGELHDGPSGDFFSYNNLCGLTGTILYNYMKDSLDSEITVVTVSEDYLERSDKNRTINILSPNLIGQLLDEVKLLLGPGVPRGTIRLLEYN